jgi:hypothetical protein
LEKCRLFHLKRSTRSPHPIACGKRNIHQRGVSGDGKGSGSGDEEMKRKPDGIK